MRQRCTPGIEKQRQEMLKREKVHDKGSGARPNMRLTKA